MQAADKHIICLENEEDTARFGTVFAGSLSNERVEPTCVYLSGDLGAGKTTLTRYILRGFGYQGVVKSPTYTLVEPYELPARRIYHFDFYRLSGADELNYLGVEDYLYSQGNLSLIEWPERGEAALPACDISISLDYSKNDDGDDWVADRRLLSFAIFNKDFVPMIDKIRREFAVSPDGESE